MKKSVLVSAVVLLTAFTWVPAFTVYGTVLDSKDEKPIEGATAKLLTRDISAVSDADGKFVITGKDPVAKSSSSAKGGKSSAEESGNIEEESSSSTKSSAGKEKSSSSQAVEGLFVNNYSRGYVRIDGGVLLFSQDSRTPVSVAVYDLMGNRIFSRILYGSGEVDLRNYLKSQGLYLARLRIGSELKTVKFAFDGSKNISLPMPQERTLLKAKAKYSDVLVVAAKGYDTLKIALENIDTTLEVTLKPAVTKEETLAFGYALKNEPRPSNGCGKNSTLRKTRSVENGERFEMEINAVTREYFITLPKKYDNTKPHKLLFAMHAMGSNAEDYVHHSPDADHPTPYYGQQNLDKNGDYIFVAPRGETDGMPWSRDDDRDHRFIDQLITTMFDNYCIDTTRVFATGFQYGAMFANSLSQDLQERLRAVAVYAVSESNIWLPKPPEDPANPGRYDAKDLPIAWMAVHGKNDGTCAYKYAKNDVLPKVVKRNKKADEEEKVKENEGENEDEEVEVPQEVTGASGHVCYDFTSVDERFPVKWCTWGGGNQWTAYDSGDWHNTWVPEEVHKFFEQF